LQACVVKVLAVFYDFDCTVVIFLNGEGTTKNLPLDVTVSTFAFLFTVLHQEYS